MNEWIQLNAGGWLLVQVHACVLSGLCLSYLDRRRPARAHLLMCWSLVAAALLPVLSGAVRQLELGQIPSPSMAALRTEPPRSEIGMDRQPGIGLVPLPVSAAFQSARQSDPAVSSTAQSRAVGSRATRGGIGWPAAWALISCGFLLWTVQSFRKGSKLAATARPVRDRALLGCFDAVREELALPKGTLLVEHPAVAGPMIWSFGKAPRMLVPVQRDPGVCWPALFRHEFAHFVRRDHWTGLCFHLLRALFPWNILAWWTLRRHEDLVESACDDWAARGVRERVEFAESLLALIPERRLSAGMQAARTRWNLKGRVHHLLHSESMARVSRRSVGWFGTSSVALALGLALAQPGVCEGLLPIQGKTATGQVRDELERPIAGAEVSLCAHTLNLPDFESPRTCIARTFTGKDGRFELPLSGLVRFHEHKITLVAWAPGKGLELQSLKSGRHSRSFDFRLQPEVVVEGQVIDVQGEPVENARVHLEQLGLPPDTDGDYRWIQALPHELLVQEQIPTTDSEGRFELPGMTADSSGAVLVEAAGYAPERRFFRGLRASETLTAVLKPERVLEGCVVADDGQGVAGARILIQSSGEDPFAGNQRIESMGVVSDANGEFVARVHPGALLTIFVRPPAEGPYRPMKHEFLWKDTTVRRQTRLELVRGVTVRGRLLDEASGAPVPDACVQWYSRFSDNPNVKEIDLSFGDARCWTDSDGQFAVSVIPGRGALLVQAGPDFVFRGISPLELDPRLMGFRIYCNGMFPLDLAPEQPEFDAGEIKIRRGKTLQARVLTADGRPSTSAVVFTPSAPPPGARVYQIMIHAHDGQFELTGLDPAAAHVLYVIDASTREGATVKLDPPCNFDGPLTIELAPCGAASVQLTDAGSKPLAGVKLSELQSRMDLAIELAGGSDNESGMMQEPTAEFQFFSSICEKLYDELRTDSAGKLSLPALIPGAPYRILYDFRRLKSFEVASGETLDLGSLAVEDE